MSSTTQSTTDDRTVGVQDLIDKLKSEGVAEGRQQADALLAEAKREAAAIIDRARGEADQLVREAQQESERTQTNGRRALALASRDASLQLKEQLEHRFRGWVGGLAHKQLDEPEFLGNLIREMATRAIAAASGGTEGSVAAADSNSIEFLVPGMTEAKVRSFVEAQAADLFREGVKLSADRAGKHGFRVRLAGGDSELDLTPEAVTAALMRFLAPKFRELIESASKDGEPGGGSGSVSNG